MPDNELEPLHPQELKDYVIAWGTVLTGQGDTAISASAWDASVPAGLTVSSTAISGTNAIVWVSAADLTERTYGLTNKMTSNGGRVLRSTIAIPVRPA